MKKFIVIVIALFAVVAFQSFTYAADNAVEPGSGVAAEGAGGLGSFFVPLYGAVGEKAVYKRTGGTGNVVRAADGCNPGDTFVLLVKGASGKKKIKHTGSGQYCECSAASSFPDQVEVTTVTNPTLVKMKAVALPGGVPSSMFVTMNGAWKQKKGSDSCE